MEWITTPRVSLYGVTGREGALCGADRIWGSERGVSGQGLSCGSLVVRVPSHKTIDELMVGS